MGHIEFIGPPGSGKSTLYRRLISYKRFYGGLKEKAIIRSLKSSSDWKRYALARYVPQYVQPCFLQSILYCGFKNDCFSEFVFDNSSYLKLMAEMMSVVDYQPQKIFDFSKRAATHYQAGASTIKIGEQFCADELFLMLAGSILWRNDNGKLPPDFFSIIPTPAVVIHVDAPVETCIQRQQDRGRIAVAEPWVSSINKAQIEFQEIFIQLTQKIEKRDIPVIAIKNTGTIDEAVEQIRSELIASQECL